MGKGSKKQKNDLKGRINKAIKTLKSRLPNFESDELEETLRGITKISEKKFPESVANLLKENEPETKDIAISFNYLNHNECFFDQFNKSITEALVRKMKDITDCNSKNKLSVIRDKINNAGKYKSLFNGLSPDIDLFELYFSESSRLFFFFVSNKCNIVSIENRHR